MYFGMGRHRLKPLYLFSHYLLYITCYFGAVYSTYWFHRSTYVFSFIMTHETYLSIFGEHRGSHIYHYLLLEHVCFVYVTNVSILLIDLKF